MIIYLLIQKSAKNNKTPLTVEFSKKKKIFFNFYTMRVIKRTSTYKIILNTWTLKIDFPKLQGTYDFQRNFDTTD